MAVMSDLLARIRGKGMTAISEANVRYAIKTGKLRRPELNSAHHFIFSEDDIEKAVRFFAAKQKATQEVLAACQ
jgi:hypothetical protein